MAQDNNDSGEDLIEKNFEGEGLFDEDNTDSDSSEANTPDVDLGVSGFPEITKRFETVPHQYFSDPNYYKTALLDEGDIAKRVHLLFQKYLGTKDPKDRGVFRAQILGSYWELLRSVAKKTVGKLPIPKKLILRFNVLHPNFISTDTKDFFSKLIIENTLNQPVYYVDEWLRAIGTGTIKASTTDEVKVAQSGTQVKMKQLLEKAMGKLDGAKTMLKAKEQERNVMENGLIEQVKTITEHTSLSGSDEICTNYSEGQKRVINDLQEVLKSLTKCDRELDLLIKSYNQAAEDVQTLREKAESEGEASEEQVVDLGAVNSEFDTIRQAAKMTIGRQGNHFPVVTSEYFSCGPNDIGYRENIISILAKIESVDIEAFCRSYRNKTTRIVPYVVLIPCYGDLGVCWEPFDKHNRASSRGRIIVPMYPKNLYIALLSAVADLRWQVAKEKASYYWMEEGLTGSYYQWYAAQKLKGEIKGYFIQDYILWMTKEAEGIQKLDKDIRGAFWRHMPFSQTVKDKLKTRSFVYQELCQRDANRAKSDSY